jgi:hypothetical protein
MHNSFDILLGCPDFHICFGVGHITREVKVTDLLRLGRLVSFVELSAVRCQSPTVYSPAPRSTRVDPQCFSVPVSFHCRSAPESFSPFICLDLPSGPNSPEIAND